MSCTLFHILSRKDGLMDLPYEIFEADREKFEKFQTKNLKSKAAVLAIIDFVNDYKNEIDFLALAPLTNLAVALNIDPSLGDKLNVCTKIIAVEI